MSSKGDRLLIVGIGQLGLRYLEGLIKVDRRLDIIVVDSSIDALCIAQKKWLEISKGNLLHNITWKQDLHEAQAPARLAIISTPSLRRISLIEEVADKIRPDYWILEKVLAQSSSELRAMDFLTADSKGVWVNTPRRLMKWHKQLKYQFLNNGPLQVSMIGGGWGLACNSIHFIDLVAWWSGESLDGVETAHLDSEWFESKRPGYFELTGTILVTYSKGTTLELSSKVNVGDRIMEIKTSCGNFWQLDEVKGVASSRDGTTLRGRLEFQSEITGPLVSSILKSGKCDLPTLSESSSQHTVFLDSMLIHWNKSNNLQDKAVPIT